MHDLELLPANFYDVRKAITNYCESWKLYVCMSCETAMHLSYKTSMIPSLMVTPGMISYTYIYNISITFSCHPNSDVLFMLTTGMAKVPQ